MTVSLAAVTFDCADAARLARFWSVVLDRPLAPDSSADFASIGSEADSASWPAWMFVRVPEGKRAKNRVHVDLVAADFGADVDRAVNLGAIPHRRLRRERNALGNARDPEGNEFDIVAGRS